MKTDPKSIKNLLKALHMWKHENQKHIESDRQPVEK